MSNPPSDGPAEDDDVALLAGERERWRAECGVLEHIVDVLVDERARLICQLAGVPRSGPSPVVPLRDYLADPSRVLETVAKRGGAVVVNERGEVLAVIRPPSGAP